MAVGETDEEVGTEDEEDRADLKVRDDESAREEDEAEDGMGCGGVSVASSVLSWRRIRVFDTGFPQFCRA